MFPIPSNPFLRYSIAIFGVALALGVGLILPSPPLEPSRSALFLAVVAVSSWVGGRGPGLLATVLSAVAIEYFLVPPFGLFFNLDEVARTAVFVFVALLISWLNGRRIRAEEVVQANKIEFDIARAIQQQLVPTSVPQVAGFEVFGASAPANATSGDYFDYFQLPGGCLGIAVGDVSGHGLGPALLMAGTRAYLRVLTQVQNDIGEILTTVNRLLSEDTEDEQFVTLFLARLDPESQSLVYASAGQEGYLLHRSGKVTRLESTGMPLGVVKDGIVACSPSIKLEPGVIVLFMTDGILEAASADESLFGSERVLEIIQTSRNKSCREMVDALWCGVRQFTQQIPQRDDMTMVIIKAELTETFDSLPAPSSDNTAGATL